MAEVVRGLAVGARLDDIADLDVPEMRFQPWRPVVPRGLEGDSSDLLAAIRSGHLDEGDDLVQRCVSIWTECRLAPPALTVDAFTLMGGCGPMCAGSPSE